jgi:protein gp37
MVFVNSMSDLFHSKVPAGFIQRVFEVMRAAGWHRFQVLTKRAGRMAQMAAGLLWPDNVWMGVTIESDKFVGRADQLRKTPAQTKFLSLEPLLGPLPSLELEGIDWVIVGGESGPGARPMDKEWVLEIKEKCELAGVPFFFKQWGGTNKKKAGRLLDGRTYEGMPRDARASAEALFATV